MRHQLMTHALVLCVLPLTGSTARAADLQLSCTAPLRGANVTDQATCQYFGGLGVSRNVTLRVDAGRATVLVECNVGQTGIPDKNAGQTTSQAFTGAGFCTVVLTASANGTDATAMAS